MNIEMSIDPTAFLWTRWIGYAISCTFLTASMITIFDIKGNKRITALISTPLIMLTGVLAAIASSTMFLIIFFLLGMIPFIVLISIFRSQANSQNKHVLNYLYYGWMAFPVIFILSPETFSIIPSLSFILGAYLIADIFTKIIFYNHTKKAQ